MRINRSAVGPPGVGAAGVPKIHQQTASRRSCSATTESDHGVAIGLAVSRNDLGDQVLRPATVAAGY